MPDTSIAEQYVTKDDLVAWLDAHGVDHRQVSRIEFVPESIADQSRVCMKVTRYALNAEGRKFFDTTTQRPHEAATEVVWVPLRSLPGMQS